MFWKPYITVALISLLSHAAGTAALAQEQVSSQKNGVTTLTLPSVAAQTDPIDYINAQSLDLPSIPAPSDAEAQADLLNALTAPSTLGEPGSSPGKRGTGKLSPTFLGISKAAMGSQDVEPQRLALATIPLAPRSRSV